MTKASHIERGSFPGFGPVRNLWPTSVQVDADGVVRRVAIGPGLWADSVRMSAVPYQGHLGLDGTTAYGASLAECIAADWDAEARAEHNRLHLNLCTAFSWNGGEFGALHRVGERADVRPAFDPFDSEDAWPTYAKSNTMDVVSPYVRLGEVDAMLRLSASARPEVKVI